MLNLDGKKNKNKFFKIKLIGEILTLFFYPNSDLIYQADASQNDLEVCFMQNGKLVAFCSRSLTKTKK